MSEIQGVRGGNSYKNDVNRELQEKNIELEDISILYTTELVEDERSSFDKTYDETSLNDASQGAKFLESLKANKDGLAEKLGLSEEQYDALACVALALASQETGMGFEEGFVSENTGFGGTLRKLMKWADVKLFKGASASSGLTQMKIYDFMNSDKLSQEQKDILKEYGISAKGVATNNLYAEPDKAAIATMVVLKSISDKYDDYQKVLSESHTDLGSTLGLVTEEDKENAIKKGEEIFSAISDVYATASAEDKIKIRTALKECFQAADGSTREYKYDKNGNKVSDDLNEGIQIEELNKLLGGKFNLEPSDMDYIRYMFTENGQEMNMAEYCALGWNKGTGEYGMKLDVMLIEKIGTILANPEDFDYDQFTVNVATLAEKYANQSVEDGGKDVLNYAFEEEV